MKTHSQRLAGAGFTVIQSLVVIAVIALLLALTIGGSRPLQRSATSNRTMAAMRAMASTLELYKNDHGDYPEPQNPGDTVTVGNKTYEVGAAAMLYQAITGDGYDNIKGAKLPANGSNSASNGSIDEQEVKNIKFVDMPKEFWINRDGRYFMADGFGRPFQYVKAVPLTSGQSPETINTTYDLWSYGDDEENTSARSIETLTDSRVKDASQKWIKNW